MGMKKIKRLIELEISKAYGEGYGNAFEGGHEAGFYEGVHAERKRVIGLFKMLSDNELEHGSGNKAKFWKEAADIVKVADEFEVFDEEGESLDYDDELR